MTIGEKIACPNHEGAFDCTPFCELCEGNQELIKPETMSCVYCPEQVEFDIWVEELRMCVDCSHKYFDGEIDPYA